MAANEPGQFLIKFSDRNESNPVNVFSASTDVISGGAVAPPTGEAYKAIPFAATGQIRTNPTRGRVLVYFNPNASDTIESEESRWEIPIVILNEAGLVVDSRTLTQEDMVGFTRAGTVDVVVVAGVPARLASFDVPRGLVYALNPSGKVRAYIGDDT